MAEGATLATLVAEGRRFVAQCNACGLSRVIEARTFPASRALGVEEIGGLMKCRRGCVGAVLTWPEQHQPAMRNSGLAAARD